MKKIIAVYFLTLSVLLCGCFPVSAYPDFQAPTVASSPANLDISIQANSARATQAAAQPYLDATSTAEARNLCPDYRPGCPDYGCGKVPAYHASG